MEFDQLVIVAGICVVMYLAGYKSLAIGLGIIIVFSSIAIPQPKRSKVNYGVNVKGAQMLEPIIIESTRGAPFRVPSTMQVSTTPFYGASPMWLKAAKNGGRVASFAARMILGKGAYKND